MAKSKVTKSKPVKKQIKMANNNADQTELIKALEAKIEEYERILKKVFAAPKTLAKIESGPLVVNDINYYRVAAGMSSTIVSYEKQLLFGKDITTDKLKEGTEVVLIEQLIVDVVPELLAPKPDEKPKFKLIGWNEIGGLSSQIDEIRQAIELPLSNEKLAKELGVEPLKGLLLYGPPGCGKTLIAKAIASMILKSNEGNDDSFVYIKGAELLSMYVGATEQRIIEIFKQCRKYSEKSGKRAVVFIDEAEAILPARGSRRSSDVDKTIVPTFLSEMDGFGENSPIMILATNLPGDIDSAILRPGRIDLKIHVARPTPTDVDDIFHIHLKNVKCYDKEKELVKLGVNSVFSCKLGDKVSGALVETIVHTAARKALDRKIADKSAPTGIIAEDLKKSIDLLAV